MAESRNDDTGSVEIKEEESRSDDRSFDIVMAVIKTLSLIGLVIAISFLFKYCRDFWTSFWGSFHGF